MFWLTQPKNSISALEIKRHLGISSVTDGKAIVHTKGLAFYLAPTIRLAASYWRATWLSFVFTSLANSTWRP